MDVPVSRRLGRRIAGGIACAALMLGACRDGTGPGGAFDIDVRVVSKQRPQLTAHPFEGPRIRCDIDLRADAAGLLAAEWEGAIARFSFGEDRATSSDSLTFSAAQVRNSWGADSLRPGASQHSEWWFSAGAPFTLTFEFRYSTRGGTGSTSVAFDCGPSADPTSAAPTISAVSVLPADRTVDIGDELTIAYSATADLGLWASAVHVVGPCEIQQEHFDTLRTSIARTVRVTVPPECADGLLPLSVFVVAWDAMLRADVHQVDTETLVMDESPPTVSASLVGPTLGVYVKPMAGHVFVGGGIYLAVEAEDNAGLAALHWEISPVGFRDSILLGGEPRASRFPSTEVLPEWVGPAEVRVFARDAQGLTSDTVRSVADGFHIHPTLSVPMQAGPVTGRTRDLVVDGARELAYLLQDQDRRVSVVSLRTMAVQRTIALPGRTLSIDLSTGGDSLLVSLPDAAAIGVIDLRDAEPSVSLLPLTELPPGTSQEPRIVRAMANGKLLITLGIFESTTAPMYEVDLAHGTQRLREDAGFPGGVLTGPFETSIDRSSAVVVIDGCLRRYEVSTDAFSPCVTPVNRVIQLRLDRTGAKVLAGRDLYDDALRPIGRMETPQEVGEPASVLSPDGTYVYQLVQGVGVVRVAAEDGTVQDRMQVPLTPNFLRVSTDGRFLVTLEGDVRGDITRIDLP